MVIFHSYVSLPEGIWNLLKQHGWKMVEAINCHKFTVVNTLRVWCVSEVSSYPRYCKILQDFFKYPILDYLDCQPSRPFWQSKIKCNHLSKPLDDNSTCVHPLANQHRCGRLLVIKEHDAALVASVAPNTSRSKQTISVSYIFHIYIYIYPLVI